MGGKSISRPLHSIVWFRLQSGNASRIAGLESQEASHGRKSVSKRTLSSLWTPPDLRKRTARVTLILMISWTKNEYYRTYTIFYLVAEPAGTSPGLELWTTLIASMNTRSSRRVDHLDHQHLKEDLLVEKCRWPEIPRPLTTPPGLQCVNHQED